MPAVRVPGAQVPPSLASAGTMTLRQVTSPPAGLQALSWSPMQALPPGLAVDTRAPGGLCGAGFSLQTTSLNCSPAPSASFCHRLRAPDSKMSPQPGPPASRPTFRTGEQSHCSLLQPLSSPTLHHQAHFDKCPCHPPLQPCKGNPSFTPYTSPSQLPTAVHHTRLTSHLWKRPASLHALHLCPGRPLLPSSRSLLRGGSSFHSADPTGSVPAGDLAVTLRALRTSPKS